MPKEKPLAGIRIVEVEGIGPGPFAAMMLADLGADVIVVHRPRSGPVVGLKDRPVINRGKRSLVLDLKSEADRKVFLALVAQADGLIEGFRPGVMERLGLGPEICHNVNPRLVYGRMTGWGQEGPLADRAGHDLNYISLAGALWPAALDEERPSASPTLIGDIGGGALYLVAGMLAGILAAGRSGKGTVVDAAIYDGAAHMQNLLMSIAGSVEEGPTAQANPLVGAHWSRTYRCADGGHISVQCLEPKFYVIFLEKLGLAEDLDFAANQFNQEAWPRLSARLSSLFSEHSRSYWEKVFEDTDACVAPVLSPREAFAHPQNVARQTWLDTDDGLQAAAAPRFDGKAPEPPGAVRNRGQDTVAILAALDKDKEWPAKSEA
ncbi:CaiB/BaiF CoA-transferase family protein [Marivita sp. XM-24bin2]|uniref:CaiB/BaiF CoA transferase family protein n=1 Tax=unclassified Marivita TaxID=2632480 RepID=UPI000D7A988A|nr:CaiB/BaiF CoA-transferase family protein [Marivita sp. XM-24bin2]MCR9110545.1 CoA transferase [Paracoccaceae bacterium]PWL33649.1 MAG: CoA transferase [Marivita sp. XM-24bin2]